MLSKISKNELLAKRGGSAVLAWFAASRVRRASNARNAILIVPPRTHYEAWLLPQQQRAKEEHMGLNRIGHECFLSSARDTPKRHS